VRRRARAPSAACASTRSSRPSTTTRRSPSCSARTRSLPPSACCGSTAPRRSATQAQRDRVAERARWEAQVLGRLGRSEGRPQRRAALLRRERHRAAARALQGHHAHHLGRALRSDARGKETADLRVRTDLWMRIAQTSTKCIDRVSCIACLRPDVVLVEDKQEPTADPRHGLRSREADDERRHHRALDHRDDRLVLAAPEVVTAFSSAEPASDQFSLGAMLALHAHGARRSSRTRASSCPPGG
jgi:hypothetical protein